MRDYLKYIIIIGLLILACIGGILYGHKMKVFKTHEAEKSEVLLEKVSKVFKMVAVEGYVSEIYDYKQYRYWDINFLRKKAMVRVKAKVSIGYDFEKVVYTVDESKKVLTITNFPEPEILSIDHDLDYFDINEGLFNSFDEKELTELNKKAKTYAIEMIKDGELFDEAELQKEKILDLLRGMVTGSGWEVIVRNKKRMIKG
ncbi:MAG: DUF4230 domain-containing protein [Saprospiraceae bacterium]|nr:DUF4230 domain-containing protein [Saprospiraceae bacterium]